MAPRDLKKLQAMKIFPRNLTARADYVVRGNPVVTRPESGTDNTHPGLEFDMRNLDRAFFPGLLFDFQFTIGARVAAIVPKYLPKSCDLTDADLKDGLFLWYVYGCFGNDPTRRTVAQLFNVDGYDVLRKVHDLEPGKLGIVIGQASVQLQVNSAQGWLDIASRLPALVDNLDKVEEYYAPFRDAAGVLQFGVFVSSRARYLDDNGVIEPEAVAPGTLTQSLCSPWQWDFADCGCYYWAGSRPDIVTGRDGKSQALNFQRARNNGQSNVEIPPQDRLTWDGWMNNTRTMSQQQMLTEWKMLPVVVNDTEADQSEPTDVPPMDDLWDRATIVAQLRHLATVEHALAIKYLYAHYSVNAPEGRGKDTPPFAEPTETYFKAAHEVFTIAIDEMRHFRWVNEALALLGEPPELSRAIKYSDLPPDSRLKQIEHRFRLEALTPREIASLIAIEAPSQNYGDPDVVSGLYTHILVSLDFRREEYEPDTCGRLQELIKLIVDEGADHYQRLTLVKQSLDAADPANYLRFIGAPQRRSRDTIEGKLQALGDRYYQVLLGALQLAFAVDKQLRGRMLEQARRSMRNLYDVGHMLGRRGQGLLFTLPKRQITILDARDPIPNYHQLVDALRAPSAHLLEELTQSPDHEIHEMATKHRRLIAEMIEGMHNTIRRKP
jgi:hypothetical protein